VANNDWKRPLYFSGGSFDDSEFIWMKDYLQLDGMNYKLVPIKTKRRNSFDMGRIDSDLMYDIVKKWEWGNSGSPDIYHDPQTRIQGISYRSNLARLTETLLAENKIDKAKEIIDMAMDNMPIDYFGYYAFVEPFVDGYYKVGETTKARELYSKVKTKYQERLQYFAGLTLDAQYTKIDDIIADMEAYRRNIDVLINNDDRDMAEKETLIFNEYIDKFSHFYKEDELAPPSLEGDPDLQDTMPISDTIARDVTKVEELGEPEDLKDTVLLPKN
jgi:tetratricopeptide (TPR) repeat protein